MHIVDRLQLLLPNTNSVSWMTRRKREGAKSCQSSSLTGPTTTSAASTYRPASPALHMNDCYTTKSSCFFSLH